MGEVWPNPRSTQCMVIVTYIWSIYMIKVGESQLKSLGILARRTSKDDKRCTIIAGKQSV